MSLFGKAKAAVGAAVEATGEMIEELSLPKSYEEAVAQCMRLPANNRPSKYWPEPNEKTCEHDSPFWLNSRECVECCKECPAHDGRVIGSSADGDRLIWFIE